MSNCIPVIRPREIFKLVEETYPNKNIELTLTMPPSGIGSLLTLESSLLVALIHITQAKNIFEIGTYNGNTTLLFANNSPIDAKILSLDLPPEDIEISRDRKFDLEDATDNDQFLRECYKSNGPFYINRAPKNIVSKVELIFENSLDFDPSKRALIGTQDIIFIDGGHDYKTVRNDTQKALKMAKSDSILIWHDYSSPIHTEVSAYLSEFSREKHLVAIGSTMLCLCFQGKFSKLLNQS